jgi:predicted DCC family thiol-disulfide oxidoreductase YuxK
MADAIVAGGRREHLALTVLHDERCPLCRRLKSWLARQATLHPVEFLAAGSPEARRRFPDLDHARTTRVLTLVTSDGAVYEGERAWLVCGWALPAWQPVTEDLAGRIRLRLVALAARTADVYRHRRVVECETCPQ